VVSAFIHRGRQPSSGGEGWFVGIHTTTVAIPGDVYKDGELLGICALLSIAGASAR